jgi:hydroxyacylglutathione hydrolase
VVDLRDDLAFGASHVPGALSIGAADDLSMWASWFVPYDTPILLVSPDEESATDAARGLVRVGLDDVQGRLLGGMAAWVAAGRRTAALPQLTLSDVADAMDAGDVTVLDVRDDDEWAAGHIRGALHIRGGEVLDRVEELPEDEAPIAVMCQTGYRSSVVASVLSRVGRTSVANVPGGVGAWQAAGLPLESG